MKQPDTTNFGPIPPVTVRRHRVDWEADDLAERTARRIVSRHQKLRQGCWYFNARFTVSCPAPTAEFYRTVLHLRSAWLRTCRQVQGKHGHGYQARQAEREGRRGALRMIDPKIDLHRSGEPALLAELSPEQHSEVIQSGHLSKQLAYSGVLLIDGEIIPPRTWQADANRLLCPHADVPIAASRRRVDLAALKATGDPEPLNSISRSALLEHLDRAAAIARSLRLDPGRFWRVGRGREFLVFPAPPRQLLLFDTESSHARAGVSEPNGGEP